MLELNKIYQGDCLELMKSIDDKSIDLVLTDPPYGVNYRNNEWDKNIPDWLAEAIRISKSVIFTTAIVTMYDYPKPDWIGCWHNIAGCSRSRIGGFNHWTPIMYYGKFKFPIDTFETKMGQTVAENRGINHPSPKPLKLFNWIIENASNENDIVLDCFIGSGTTAIACMQTNRNFIGIELEPKYVDIANKRIQDFHKQECLI
jgi:site-specific DNA-methyltransferase (adenine-specific)